MEPETIRRLRIANLAPFEAPNDANLVLRCNRSAPLDTRDGMLCLLWKDEAGVWHEVSAAFSTRPSRRYLQAADRHPDGAAELVVGVRNAGSHALGYHKSDPDRPAFVQVGKVKVRRDDDGDAELDPEETVFEGVFGINCHDGPPTGSAGCPMGDKAALLVLIAAFKELQAKRPQRTVSLAVVEG